MIELFLALVGLVLVFGPWLLSFILFSRISSLREQLGKLERTVVELQYGRPQPPKPTSPVAAPVQAPATSVQAPTQQPTPPPSPAPAPAPAPTPKAPPTPPTPPPPKKPSKTREEMEMLVGGTWLSRIGAIAVVLGTLFFLKYAFDRGWIAEWMRVAIGLTAGVAMIAASEWWRRKNLNIFAQAMAGAGIPILYLSVYASYGFYSLVSQPIAFAGMCVVTLLTIGVALRHGSVYIAIMAALGGMCTPWWLSTGEMNTVGLFGYIAALSAGLFALSTLRPRWLVVGAIGYVGTWLWWAIWSVARSDMPTRDELSGTILASLCMAIGMAYHYVVERRIADDLQQLRRILNTTHLVLMFVFVLAALDSAIPWHNELAAGIMGVVFIAMALPYRAMQCTPASSMHLVLGLLALTQAVSNENDAYTRAIAWAILGLGASFLLRDRFALTERIVARAIVGLAVMAAIADDRTVGITSVLYIPIANPRLIALAVSGIATILVTRLFKGAEGGWKHLLDVGRSVGYVALLLAVHREVFDVVARHAHEVIAGRVGGDLHDFYMAQGHAFASMASVIAASLLLLISRRLKDEAAVYAGMLGLVMGAAWWMTHASAVPNPGALEPYMSMRTLTGVLIMVSIAPIILVPSYTTPVITQTVRRAASGILLVLFSFLFCTIEVTWTETITIHRLYEDGMTSHLDDAWNRFHLRMSGTWIVYSILLMILGFVRRLRAVRVGALLLLLVTILKVFLYDLSYLEQPYRIVSFIALGVILLVAGFLYQRFKHVILNAPLEASNPVREDQGSEQH